MFKYVAVLVFMIPGLARAEDVPPKCLFNMVNTHQVLVTGEYGGKPFAFTMESQSPLRPGQKTPPLQASDQPCPQTS